MEREDGTDYRTDEEGYQYAYDYHYVEPDQDEEEEEEEAPRRVKRPHKKYLVMIQMVLCLLVLLAVMVLKAMGGAAYGTVKDWYSVHLNDSLIAQEKINGVTEAWVEFFASPRSGQKTGKPVNPPVSSAPPAESSASGVTYTTSIYSKSPVMVSVFLDVPVKGGVITSGFGMRGNKPHRGVDIAAQKGSSIYPALPGTVTEAAENDSYGKYLLIDHGRNIVTRYAHCESLLVKKGDAVTYGKPIALVGSTGDSDGPHVHFELILSGVCYDPQPLLKSREL
ncbi:M23 family peptidase [Ruminococcaceae bacterium BL-6]|nr:M23 family peptidase [Ruminococcaceae bacterium BL-6]